MSSKGREFVAKYDNSQQFPAYLPDELCGNLAATTSNWAEQEMSACRDTIRSSPNLLTALIRTVVYASRIYQENYAKAHAVGSRELVPEFDDALIAAKKRALEHGVGVSSNGGDNLIARCTSATKPNTVYVSVLSKGGSTCTCGVLKTTRRMCWHHFQHLREFKFRPHECNPF